MGQRKKSADAGDSAPEQEMRDQEVLRANLELASYFKGRRTEREARAALKIIKAFVRDRERLDPRSRPPLPGLEVGKTSKEATNGKATPDAGEQPRPSWRDRLQNKSSKRVAGSIESPVTLEPAAVSEPDE